MPQQIDQLLQSCTVKITVPGQPGWGTGFFVAPGLILTCAHVVKSLTFEATAQIGLEQFPQLRALQQQFHQQDRRWIELLEAGANLDDLLAQIEAGAITSADLQRLREVLASGSSQLSQLGKYNINVGQGQDIQIGDRTYVEINEAAVAAIVAAIQQSVSAAHPPPSPSPPPAVSSLKEAKPMPPANAIFISYRRSDSHDVTGRIYDRLSEHFGRDVVFKDVHSIPLGVDFRTHLNQGVGNCLVLVAVIGPTWLNVQGTDGKRRLDNPDDWVRAEIETALTREIPVIPLLVGGAHLPRVDELPEPLKSLAYRNATQARPDPDFHRDLDRLIRSLEEIVGIPEPSVSSKPPTERDFYARQLARKQNELADVEADLETAITKSQETKFQKKAKQLLDEIKELEKQLYGKDQA